MFVNLGPVLEVQMWPRLCL